MFSEGTASLILTHLQDRCQHSDLLAGQEECEYRHKPGRDAGAAKDQPLVLILCQPQRANIQHN